MRNYLALFASLCGLAVAKAEAPSPEKLLPEDTLLMITARDVRTVVNIFKSSPEAQLWEDPAIRPFKEKFLERWSEEFIKPLERELKIRLEDYASLPQGQVTFAVTRGTGDKREQPLDLLLLVDTQDKNEQLRANLAALTSQWLDSNKPIRTEKIREFEFIVRAVSSNDVPRTFRKFFPPKPQVQEIGGEEESKSFSAHEIVMGQAGSLFIAGNSLKAVERIVIALTDGTLPFLGGLGSYDADHQEMFREAPLYGWINVKALAELVFTEAAVRKRSAMADPFETQTEEQLLVTAGLASLKTIAFSFQDSPDGALVELLFRFTEKNRQAIFEMFSGASKESGPPAFVPADVVKFERWRLDFPKAWVMLQKTLGSISPQWLGGMNLLLDAATAVGKEKNTGFDVKKSLIENLGDDIIRYQKAPRGSSLAAMRSPPSLVLVGSPNPEPLAAAIKSVLLFLNQQGAAPTEREFLGRKIFSLPAPALPLPLAAGTKSRTLSCAASGGYVALSSDASMIEEFLRSSENQSRTLSETAGLAEAAQRVNGPGTFYFSYENQVEKNRTVLELLKKDPASVTNALMESLPVPFSMFERETAFRELMDFSLLPVFDRIAKYFHFTVVGGRASAEGLSVRFFAPTPPQMRAAQSSTRARP